MAKVKLIPPKNTQASFEISLSKNEIESLLFLLDQMPNHYSTFFELKKKFRDAVNRYYLIYTS